MILDERLEFADALAIPTPLAKALVGDVVDLGVAARDIGAGDPIWFVVQITTTVTSAGASTIVFELVSDAQAAIAVDGTATVHFASGALPKAALIAGYPAVATPLPRHGPAYERYLGVLATPAAFALTAGAVNAFLTRDYAKFKAYDNAVIA